MAKLVSTWSKHPDFQVGAVAVGEYGQILTTGYNGWPRGLCNEEEGHARAQKPSLTIHAETNVIYNASLMGIPLRGSALYVYPLFPCVDCAKAIVQVGISQICYPTHDGLPWTDELDRLWKASWRQAEAIFRETGVEVIKFNGK